jgi:hypothetical protein
MFSRAIRLLSSRSIVNMKIERVFGFKNTSETTCEHVERCKSYEKLEHERVLIE